MNFVCLNGKMIPAAEPVLFASNRSYRYGDGLFETMRMIRGKIPLSVYHFERLFSGLAMLQYEIPGLFTAERLQKEIIQLCEKNKCADAARIRLSVFRGNGGLYDEDKNLQYLVECWPLPETVNVINENGLVIDICPDVRKSADKFSGLKSANFLPYSIAALFAKQQRLNDCLVLNSRECIADSTIASIFLIKDKKLLTPALGEGCVAGVMRRYLLQSLTEAGYTTAETAITEKDMEDADEVFLTNAIYGIRWVKQFRNAIYSNNQTVEIYNRFVKTIFS